MMHQSVHPQRAGIQKYVSSAKAEKPWAIPKTVGEKPAKIHPDNSDAAPGTEAKDG